MNGQTMTIYSIVYLSPKGEWRTFRGNEGNGLYLDFKTARSIATRLRNKNRAIETYVMEAEPEWEVLEVKGR